ncbi:MAG TPA: hypothetical protein VGJ21_13305 [Terracidiphilus sp.]
MHFPASFVTSMAAAALTVCAAGSVFAQESSSQTQAPPTTTAPQPAPAYIAIDPLAGVRYDNKWDLSLELAYDHMKAGPNLLQGSNLGGVNLSGSYFLGGRWRVEGTFRPYLGTSGAAPNPDFISGPFVAQYMFAGGPEWIGPHNKHGAMVAHILAGGSYGQFEKDLRGLSPEVVGFYNNQVAPVVIMGGHFDLNRSEHWVLRMTPDAILTDYATNYGKKERQIDINAAFSVGVEYRFLPKKRK